MCLDHISLHFTSRNVMSIRRPLFPFPWWTSDGKWDCCFFVIASQNIFWFIDELTVYRPVSGFVSYRMIVLKCMDFSFPCLLLMKLKLFFTQVAVHWVSNTTRTYIVIMEFLKQKVLMAFFLYSICSHTFFLLSFPPPPSFSPPSLSFALFLFYPKPIIFYTGSFSSFSFIYILLFVFFKKNPPPM